MREIRNDKWGAVVSCNFGCLIGERLVSIKVKKKKIQILCVVVSAKNVIHLRGIGRVLF